jgi:hypothetical protein
MDFDQEIGVALTRVNKKPGKEPDMNVSFPMKLAWQAD